MLTDLGLTVTREIPLETLGGLISGAYSLHGGVVRNAAGQIVSHLVTSGAPAALNSLIPGAGLLTNLVQSGQIWQLSKDVSALQQTVDTVLSVAAAGTVLSGLGLVTSIAGFAYLSRRLGQVDAKLAKLDENVRDIKQWLGSLERSRLQFAIDNMQRAELASDGAQRQQLLLQCNEIFGTLTHHYKQQWALCRTLPEVETVNELYTLSIIGHSMVASDLGLALSATGDLRSHCRDWTAQARQHTKKFLLGTRPERWLEAEYVDQLPSAKLVRLMDFAHGTDRGIDWFDDLRVDRAKSRSVSEALTDLAPELKRYLRDEDKSIAFVGIAESLCARADVMAANVAHYEFLEANRLTATGFQRQLELERQRSGAEAVCVQLPPPQSAAEDRRNLE